MSLENNEASKMSHGEAMLQICAIEQQVQIMGANDYEPEAFRTILHHIRE